MEKIEKEGRAKEKIINNDRLPERNTGRDNFTSLARCKTKIATQDFQISVYEPFAALVSDMQNPTKRHKMFCAKNS